MCVIMMIPITIIFVYRKYKRASSTTKLILTLDDIVFIDTQVSRKVGEFLLLCIYYTCLLFTGKNGEIILDVVYLETE